MAECCTLDYIIKSATYLSRRYDHRIALQAVADRKPGIFGFGFVSHLTLPFFKLDAKMRRGPFSFRVSPRRKLFYDLTRVLSFNISIASAISAFVGSPLSAAVNPRSEKKSSARSLIAGERKGLSGSSSEAT